MCYPIRTVSHKSIKNGGREADMVKLVIDVDARSLMSGKRRDKDKPATAFVYFIFFLWQQFRWDYIIVAAPQQRHLHTREPSWGVCPPRQRIFLHNVGLGRSQMDYQQVSISAKLDQRDIKEDCTYG